VLAKYLYRHLITNAEPIAKNQAPHLLTPLPALLPIGFSYPESLATKYFGRSHPVSVQLSL